MTLPGRAADPITITVWPAATGRQLVRASLPFPAGFLKEGELLRAMAGRRAVILVPRVLTWHLARDGEPRSARRALITFPYTFTDIQPVRFTLHPEVEKAPAAHLPVSIHLDGEILILSWRGGPTLKACLLAPTRSSEEAPRTETVESGPAYLWRRYMIADPQWPRVIEVRADALGGVVVIAHLQRNLPEDGYAPDFGWEVEGKITSASVQSGKEEEPEPLVSSFRSHTPSVILLNDQSYQLYHPAAPFKRRGRVEAEWRDGKLVYRYFRCVAEEKVPMQPTSWRRAEFVVGPAKLAHFTPTLLSPHRVQVEERLWDELYQTGKPLDLQSHPPLTDILKYHHDAIVASMVYGDDWGNLTSFSDGQTQGSVYGMNRLNHCPPIFEEAYRSGDRRLLEAALLWCDNFYDLSIWWGPVQRGGTRYNNILASGKTPPGNDRTFMWRSNHSVSFCTKGFASFFYAYEETGDPRMKEALDSQTTYAAEYLHAGAGTTRDVGAVGDFLRLYRFTGEERYLQQALRLFAELRTQLSTGDLFTESGKPITPDGPYIEDDAFGVQHPFAKPYILGYALAGLPELARLAPDEPKLRQVVEAVADFMATSQDPIGGWRYPHPRSSHVIMSQAMEHAWQLVQAASTLGPRQTYLDAIEKVLRQRIQGWLWTGRCFSGMTGWEIATGKVKETKELYTLYAKPEDRDYIRDQTEGRADFGYSPPEGLVYFPEVLAFYLQHRPAWRLLAPPTPDAPLGKVLGRIPQRQQASSYKLEPPLLVKALNPRPETLPTLGVWMHEEQVLVSITLPDVPGFTCDAWCYESPFDLVDARAGERGSLILRHCVREDPRVLVVTQVLPEPGAVEFRAHLEMDPEKAPTGALPDIQPFVNLCWQLVRAPSFASAPDPYPEFIKRCFIFTEKGLTFLDKTTRRKIPVRPPEHAYNNPPWVQMYVGVWQEVPKAGPDSWADYSPDRYTYRIIGAVSRDGKYLAALANDTAALMAQAWHDCMHNNATWSPVHCPPERRIWRIKLYVMENSPQKLLRRVKRDFPRVGEK